MLIGDNSGVKAQAVAGLPYAVVDFVVLGAAQFLVIAADGLKDLPAIGPMEHGFSVHLPHIPAEGGDAAAKEGILCQQQGFPPRGRFRENTGPLAASHRFPAFQAADVLFHKLRGNIGVGVHPEDDVSGKHPQGHIPPAGEGSSGVVQHLDAGKFPGVFPGKGFHTGFGAVGGSAVHQEDFHQGMGVGLGQKIGKQCREGLLFIPGNDAEGHCQAIVFLLHDSGLTSLSLGILGT